MTQSGSIRSTLKYESLAFTPCNSLTTSSNFLAGDFETGNISDEFDGKYDDEFNKYLKQRIEINSIDDNPLKLWFDHRFIYPVLSKLTRSLYSILANTANIEREFSACGLMVNSRRTRLNPQQVNNALLIG